MVALFVCLILAILMAGAGFVILNKAGVKLAPKTRKKPSTDAELDEEIAVEDLHAIIAHRYVPYSHDETRVLAQVECICGWTDAVATTSYAKSRGEYHVNNERDKIRQKRETARIVAEKLAENEKGDFAW